MECKLERKLNYKEVVEIKKALKANAIKAFVCAPERN